MLFRSFPSKCTFSLCFRYYRVSTVHNLVPVDYLSTDLTYLPPCLKATATPATSLVYCSEVVVCNWLDKLKPTSPGRDMLPHWLLKIAACFIAKPYTCS